MLTDQFSSKGSQIRQLINTTFTIITDRSNAVTGVAGDKGFSLFPLGRHEIMSGYHNTSCYAGGAAGDILVPLMYILTLHLAFAQ